MTTPGDERADLRERLARALEGAYPRPADAWDDVPATLDGFRRYADALLPVVTAHTDDALAEQREQMVEAIENLHLSGGSRISLDRLGALSEAADIVREVGGS